jgi:type VI secretion system protein ImpG
MQTEDKVPVVRISCLNRPTPPVYPPVEGRTIWYLVSGLSLNYLSLSDNAVSAESLREIMRLYSFGDSPSAFQQVEGVRAVSCRPVSRRIGKEPWRGFCRGHEVTIRFDESMYVGSGAFLMGAVLNRFLALYTAVNSFTELVMESEQREGIWKRWPAASGLQELL